MTSHHIVNVTFNPKPEHAKEFEELMQSVKTDLPNAKGCIGVRVLRHKEAPSIYTLIEDWETADLHSAHIEGLISSGAWANIEAMLIEAPSSTLLNDI